MGYRNGQSWARAGRGQPARAPQSEEFNKGLKKKVSGLGALARSWKSGSEGRGPKSEECNAGGLGAQLPQVKSA